MWAKNLALKASFLSAFFLLIAFISSFYSEPLSKLLLLFVYFISGTPALQNSIENLKKFKLNIGVLMTLAAFLSFFFGSEMEGGLLFVLFAFSNAMEKTASKKAKETLFRLSKLSPKLATVVQEDGTCLQKSVSEIEIESHILIRAGEIVPLDGIVVQGSSFVNLSHLTGESIPVSKSKGDQVKAGSRNLDGTLTLRVSSKNSDSTLSTIIQLIHQAQNAKPRLQRFLDSFGRRYAMIIIVLFFLFSICLPWIFPLPYFGGQGSIYRSLAFLIAASPCALIIATPTAYLSAISACARNGILLKGGGMTLDAFASCQTVAFDKTGTLTTGQLSLERVDSLSEEPACTIDQAIQMAASLERHATHPMAKAILESAKEKKLKPLKVDAFQSIAGSGLKGRIQQREILIGNAPFIREKLLSKRGLKPSLFEEGDAMTFLLIDQSLFVFCFKDSVRPQAFDAINDLKKTGKLDVMMLTGDHSKSGSAVAHTLGIKRFFANLRPEHKLKKVSELSEKSGLAMVGDGINDAPALARATVGISMGKIGSSMAIDASDIVFLKDDLSSLSWLYDKARKTVRIVRENLILSLMMIVIATIPALLGWAPLWIAVLLHEGGTLLVALNGLRLLKE